MAYQLDYSPFPISEQSLTLTIKLPPDKVRIELTGLVQVFTGNGRGKTSAAMGTVLRAAGQGLRVFIVFFMKGNYPSGEQKALSYLPNVTMAMFGSSSFVDPKKVKDEDKEEARKALAAAREAMHSGKYDLVVLDEVNIAAAWGLIGVDEVVELIHDRPEDVELILTGRYADPELVRLADLVTEMLDIKHPYEKGMPTRLGFEY
jgi:cob(I)alamin adenosyltransferase